MLIKRENRENRELARARSQESWDPFRMMDALLRWEPFWEGPGGLFHRGEAFVPRFDVKENKEGYVIRADMPGVKEKDLEVSLAGNMLSISGHREDEHKQEGDHYFATERTYGQFARSFSLPEGADGESIRADLKDGVLTVYLTKRPEVQARKIPISKDERGMKS